MEEPIRRRRKHTMNDNANLAFSLDVELPEETLISLTTAVDQLDDLQMILDGVLFVPEQDTSLEHYVERATRYLIYLLERIREEDLEAVSTAPLEEDRRRTRISTLLRAANRGARA
jgi:hypothetical protein